MTGATVLYDGDCGLCTAFVRAASRRLRVPVTAIAWQRADLAALGVSPEDARLAIQWIRADGERLQGHRAVAAWLHDAGRGWRVLAALMTAPGLDAVAAAVYRLVAANRSCAIRTRPASI